MSSLPARPPQLHVLPLLGTLCIAAASVDTTDDISLGVVSSSALDGDPQLQVGRALRLLCAGAAHVQRDIHVGDAVVDCPCTQLFEAPVCERLVGRLPPGTNSKSRVSGDQWHEQDCRKERAGPIKQEKEDH